MLSGYLFCFNKRFWRFKLSSWSKWFVVVFPLCFIIVIDLIWLWSFLIPGFVSANVKFDKIVCDKVSSLQMLFLSSTVFFSLTWVYSVFLCEYIISFFLLLLFSPLLLFSSYIIFDSLCFVWVYVWVYVCVYVCVCWDDRSLIVTVIGQCCLNFT